MATTRRAAKAAPTADAPAGLRILKKYPNRRLYDTQISSYITLTEVKTMVLAGQAFEVRDAKTGDDLTRSILLQIILEEETGGVPLFSANMLSQIIRFYGHAMQGVMGSYLEKNLQSFTDAQARLAEPLAMGNVLEQSRHMFVQMQEQMARQASSLFPGIPVLPVAPAAAAAAPPAAKPADRRKSGR